MTKVTLCSRPADRDRPAATKGGPGSGSCTIRKQRRAVAFWDLNMRQAGWVPVGGICAPSGDPIYGVDVTGLWRKTVQGTCASFGCGVESRVRYTLNIRPVGDPTRGCSASTLGIAPGPVGCRSTS